MLEHPTADASFTRIEEGVRRFWRLHGVPVAFYGAHRLGPTHIFYQQPLFALGEDPDSQVSLLATTDLLARYLTMRRRAIQCHGGWVCHGLPVELALEQALGPDVADYDLARFNDACRQAVLEAVRRNEVWAERMAIWPGPGSTFLSLDPIDIGRVWSVLHRLYQDGLLREEHRVVGFCPRCATPLAVSETARQVTSVESPSVWFQLPWDGEPNTYLLAWAAQPWMLVGMVALAAHPATSYVLVEMPAQKGAPPVRLILAEGAVRRSLPEGGRLIRRVSARALRGARYRPPFTFLPADEGTGRILIDDAVPQNRGTGLWPVTPAFEPLSLQMAQQHSLPIPDLLDDWGKLDGRALSWRGLSPLDAEPLLIADLEARGLLFRRQEAPQQRSSCPHCQAAIFPLARTVWLVDSDVGPWVVSRERAWGVPLPVWVCQKCGRKVSVAGVDDLAERAGLQAAQIDPHRPAIDQLVLPCDSCEGAMHRVSGVLDAGFEAAGLTWTAVGEPDVDGAHASITVGLGGAHSGWLDGLSTIAILHKSAIAWDHVLTFPDPQTGSEPGSLVSLERFESGDALRWAAYAGIDARQVENDLLRPVWQWAVSIPRPGESVNTVPGREAAIGGIAGELLDRWLSARVYETVHKVVRAMDGLDHAVATHALADLLSDLIHWYVPLRPGAGDELVVATLTRMLAPFLPHLAEAIHRHRGGRTAASVHLAGWPKPDPAWEDGALVAQMARVKRLAAMSKTALADADLRADQWTGQAVAGLLDDDPAELAGISRFAGVLEWALSAERVRFVPGAAVEVRYRLSLDPRLRVERTVSATEIEAALASLDATHSEQLVAELRAGLSISLPVLGQNVALLPEDVMITVQAEAGWIAAADSDLVIRLELMP